MSPPLPDPQGFKDFVSNSDLFFGRGGERNPHGISYAFGQKNAEAD